MELGGEVPFKEIVEEHQKRWCRQALPSIKERDADYDHVFLKKDAINNFYPGIQDDLFCYLKDKGITPHSSIRNLNSSWALCANLYWPFRNIDGFMLLKQYLNQFSRISIDRIEEMMLEHEEEDNDLKPPSLLGEPLTGHSGGGQTSPDLALKFITKDGKKGILLVESKFIEPDFEYCIGYDDSERNKCAVVDIVSSDFQKCYLKCKLGRKYWDLLKDDLNREKYLSLGICPIKRCYQLFRQQALANGLKGKYDIVVSCTFIDSRNEGLIKSSRSTGLSNFPEGWRELFSGLQFECFTHNNWFEFVKTHNAYGMWNEWVNYIGKRYFEIGE